MDTANPKTMSPQRNPTSVRPITVASPRGELIGFYHPPIGAPAALGDVLLVPAFAEELNRCRSMVTQQAQAFAGIGIGTLVLDLYGTGDSPGEFDAADWASWSDDLQCGLKWLRTYGNGCQTLWGVRLGALMAAQLAVREGSGIGKLLMWTPVINGKTYWTQFLRIRIASEMGLPDGIKSTETLRKQSAVGQVVEASGYLVGPTLAQQLDSLEMPAADKLVGKTIAWFEVGANTEATMPRANAKLVGDWQSKDVPVTVTQVVGPPFWQVHEREVAPLLVEAGTSTVAAWSADNPSAVVKARPTDQFPTLPTTATEYPVVFRCLDADLTGIVHRGASHARIGVVIVVAGGPQYRVGAHRQFVSLARMFASNGYPVLRFDLRGMGDSSGEYVGYEQSAPDIRAAIDAFQRCEPGVQEIVLFGECESASGILFYAGQDARVRRIALANPWVRTPGVQAETILKHYYLDRLRSREFWLSVRRGEYKLAASVASFYRVLSTFAKGRNATRARTHGAGQADFDELPLPNRTAEGLRRFSGKVLLLMSGRDLIAREFDEVTKSSKDWRGLLSDRRITRKDIADADHTFSKPEIKAEAQQTLLDWLADKTTLSSH